MVKNENYLYNTSMITKIVKAFLVIATVLYGAGFVYSLSSAESIEKNARGFIKHQVSKKTHEKIDNTGTKYKDNKLVKLSAKIFKKKTAQIKLYKKALKEKIDEKIVSVMAKMSDMSCECRQKYTKFIHGFIVEEISDLKKATKKLEEFMMHKYMFVVQNLIKDFRIFLGSSFLILLLMSLMLYLKPQANLQINLLAVMMMASTFIGSYMYVFKQNWFYTIIYNDYIGFAYLAYMGIVFLLLLDIIFNKARVTTEIVNAILNIIGSAVSAVPC